MYSVPVPRPGTLIIPDWLQSSDGRDYLTCILRKKKRRTFGLLERPALPPQLPADLASYKVFVCGKSGVGKTSLIAKLCGLEVPTMHHETTGIQTSCVFWPVRPRDSDRPIIFAFQFWDCGESALKKFDHILPACKEKADAILFLFSFTDRSSFEDVPALISRTMNQEENAARVVIGTKLDQFMHTDVTEQDIRDFQQTWQLPVMRVRSVNGPRLSDGRSLDGGAELADAAPVLNGLAEVLWHRDQITAGLVDIGECRSQEETSDQRS
ncbi:ciliogenesis and planar polarity effector 2 isoform X1 [Bufo bufo]|uniref:ciliogenesis and planar polarity effector 2 isoform X1 n=1 Tax=Bufo bufo TaxID=8384 RepID=UPI001ABE894D|nr:ciliogenesis and planar polarity effector 2 isoform X1 [Bufo bufo]